MIQKNFDIFTSNSLEYLTKHPQSQINLKFELTAEKITEKLLSEVQDLNSFSDDSLSTKDSEENSECTSKKNTMSQKKSYKKAPQGKMDSFDEELLLSLASKYKHDWKKVSKKIFKLHKKKLGPNLLRIRYKELAPDLTQKRVRFTHKEDLLIVKLYSQFGYDWEKIASEFESRTSIMVKNRFYHIKKKNILQSLLNEVDATTQVAEEKEAPKIIEEQPRPDSQNETVHFLIQKGDEILSQKLTVFSDENLYFKYDEQLCDKITPLGEWNYNNNSFIEEDNYFSLTSFMGQRFLYY